MKMSAFLDMTSSSLVEVNQRFGGSYCHHHQVYFDETTLHHISESCLLHTRRHENLKSFLETACLSAELRIMYLQKNESAITITITK
jgi:hypothetical protein